MKIGLVLEGGGMRGLYTAGVLDTFIEQGIRVDGIIGVSAGALFGVDYCSGQKGRVLRYTSRFVGDDRYMSVKSLIKTGNYVGKEFAYHEVPHHLEPFDEEAYEKSGVDFYAVATNVETGEPEYLLLKNVLEQMDMLRASGSLPFVSEIVEIDGKKYLDGGIFDSIPVEKCKELGYDKIIVVLTRPLDYRKKPTNTALAKLLYRKYKKMTDRLGKRHEEYNAAIEKVIEMEKNGELFVIRPSVAITAGRTEKNPEKLKETHTLGVKDCLEALLALKKYLEA